ncbi:CLB2 [Candida oxycetoniae]|uniref:CLB2 n=1 Tax=Candida oxycetoniae TaxID=497107 RepID=A0AAI9SVY1_9ASCO|nr:CLB2 [Candida oxycetoniae]KAI3403719.2 CLB2 [Candida oxycetoniae]
MPKVTAASTNNENDYRLTRSKIAHLHQKHQLSSSDTVIYSNSNNQLSCQEPMETSTQNDEENIPPVFSNTTTTAGKSANMTKFSTRTITTTRRNLGDVSSQYHASSVKPSQQSQQQNKKRKPFGGDFALLHPHNKTTSNAAAATNTTKSIPIAEDAPSSNSVTTKASSSTTTTAAATTAALSNANTNTNFRHLMVPSRLPLKRQATESSTNLVEKLKIPQPQDQILSSTAAAVVAGAAAASAVASSSSSLSTTIHKKSRLIDYEWQDLDEEDHDDPLMASEYVNDIFTYFYELETRMLPDPNYINNQKNYKPKMRSILVDWMVEMHLKFRLLPESLFLAINTMDRFMSIEHVELEKLQLLATGSLFIAAKYEEVFSPSVKNYAYFTDGSYTEEQILQAEKYILTTLNFDLNYPNPMNFLRRISKADDYDVQSRTLGKYLLEITIIDHKFIGMKPSLCCASAMYLARLILEKRPVWNGNLIHYSGGYRINDMRVCIELMFQYLLQPVEHEEFFKKYAMRKFMKASTLCQNWARKFFAEEKDIFDESLSTHRLSIE